jgi:GNAT superfamily N-acetyltransferase
MSLRERTFTVRPYRETDQDPVVDLLNRALKKGPIGMPTAELFRWKHLQNPFGRSFMIVAHADNRIIGLRAFMRWRFRVRDRSLAAVRAVDTATDPEYQRRGVFSQLTRRALDDLSGQIDFVFNTPNDKSLPGYLKMGWRLVGKIPVRVRVRRPLRVAAGVMTSRDDSEPPWTIDAPPAAEVLRAGAPINDLLAHTEASPHRIGTDRDLEYLHWRYSQAPGLDYRAVAEERDGSLRGLAFFRVRRRGGLWETSVADILTEPGDRGTAGRLLRRIIRAARVDHVAASFPRGLTASRAARRRGFLPWPTGVTLVVNPLRKVEPDPDDRRSWALSLGDLEVF